MQGGTTDLEFVFGGIVALVGSDAAEDFRAFVDFSEREVGVGVLAKLLSLAQRKEDRR